MLLAFLIYNDGIGTIIRMATVYGTEIGIDQGALIAAILLVQFVGIPFSFLFGMLAGSIGAKRAMFLGLLVYTAHQRPRLLHEDGDALLRARRAGGHGAGGDAGAEPVAVREPDAAAQVGGVLRLLRVFEKFAGIFGPLIFAGTIAATGSSRNAILSVIAFFAVGALLLSRVNLEEGREAALAGEAALRTER